MRKRIMLPLLGLLCSLVLLGAGLAQAQAPHQVYDLSWYVIGGGGQMGMAGGGQTMGLTAAQTAIGWSEDENGLGSGFWYGVRWRLFAGEYDIYLPLVTRSYTGP